MKVVRILVPLLVLAILIVAAAGPIKAGVTGEGGRPTPEPSVSNPPPVTPTPPTPTPPTPTPPTPTPPTPTPPTPTPTPPDPTPPPPPVYHYDSNTVIHRSSETHRVVKGYARRALKPNMLDNDWDNVSRKSLLGRLSDAEERYLKSLTGLRNGVTYYADITGRSLSTSAFRNKSVETKRTKTTSTVVKAENGRQHIYVTETTHVYITDINYQVIADLYDSSPLVLDLNDDGKIDVAKNEWQAHAPKFYQDYALQFDITGDGEKDAVEWVKPSGSDGILVKPEDGQVKSALQMFGTAGGYSDGFEKLSLTQDSNKNGWIEGRELEGLFVWIDADSDGVCAPQELRSLAEYGIKRISTRHQNYASSYVTADGKTHKMWDWWPATMELRKFRTQ